MSSSADHFYTPTYDPFHVTEEGFRVWETTIEGKYICTDLLQTTYRGDMKGVVRFIERRRKEMNNVSISG